MFLRTRPWRAAAALLTLLPLVTACTGDAPEQRPTAFPDPCRRKATTVSPGLTGAGLATPLDPRSSPSHERDTVNHLIEAANLAVFLPDPRYSGRYNGAWLVRDVLTQPGWLNDPRPKPRRVTRAGWLNSPRLNRWLAGLGDDGKGRRVTIHVSPDTAVMQFGQRWLVPGPVSWDECAQPGPGARWTDKSPFDSGQPGFDTSRGLWVAWHFRGL